MATSVLQRPLSTPLPSIGEVADGFRRHELVTRASAIAFRVLYATVPFAMFVLAAAGLLRLESLWTTKIAPDIAPHVSAPVFAVLDAVALNALTGQRAFWVTAGLALSIWEVSSAVRVIQGCLDDIYGAEKRRSFQERLPTSPWVRPGLRPAHPCHGRRPAPRRTGRRGPARRAPPLRRRGRAAVGLRDAAR